MTTRLIAAALVLAACRGERWPPRAPEPALSIQVLALGPGWSSDEVERFIAIPIETAFAGAPIAGVRSTSEFGQARIAVDFASDDVLAARQEVIDRLQGVQLPPGIEPMVGRTSLDRIALRYLVRGPAMAARTFADWSVERALKMIAGVDDVDGRGGDVEQMQVTLDPQRLAAHGVTSQEVASAIASAKPSAGGSTRTSGFVIRGVNQLESVEAIGDVVVKATVRVSDVASVARGGVPRDCDVTDARGDDVVEGIVWARPSADLDAVRALAERKLAELAKAAPPGIAIEPLALDVETLVNVPAGAAMARTLAAKAGAVVEACRALPLEGGVPDDVVVLSKVPLADIPGVRVVPPGQAVWIRITGPDAQELGKLADAVAADAAKLGVAVTARVGTVDVPRISIEPDRKSAARYGVTANDIAEATRLALGGVEVGTSYQAERRVDIVMRLVVAPADAEAIRAIAIAAPDGARIPLGEVAAIRVDAAPRAIVREGGARVVAVRVHLADDDQGTELHRALDRIALPEGYRLTVTSSSSSTL